MTYHYNKLTVPEIAKNVQFLSQELIERSPEIDPAFEGQSIDSLLDAQTADANAALCVYALKLFLQNAHNDFVAARALVENQLYNSAFMCVRRLFELSVDLYLAADQLEDETRRFLRFDRIQQWLFFENIQEYLPDLAANVTAQEKTSLHQAYRKAMKILGYRRKPKFTDHWSNLNLRDRCEKLDKMHTKLNSSKTPIEWKKLYEIIFRQCCLYAHPTPRGMMHDMTAGNPHLVIIAPATTMLLLILEKINEKWDAGLDADIQQVRRVMYASGWRLLFPRSDKLQK